MKIMNIGVDAGALGIKDDRLKAGTYQVAKNLLIKLAKLDQTNQYTLFSFYPIGEEITSQLGKNFKNISFWPARGFFQFRLPMEFILNKFDLFLALNQALPWFHPFKSIVFVHDLAFERFQKCYPESYIYLDLKTKYAARNCDRIIVPSKAVLDDLVSLYRIKEEKIKVIYEGVNKLPEIPTDKFKKYQPYFLYFGALKRIKNLPRLLQAFAMFKKDDNRNFKLILAGTNYWLDPDIKRMIKKTEIEKSVVNLGHVKDQELFSLYSNAFAFVSPSLYEGFGLTAMEAMACSCPVIAGNIGAGLEIVGQAGLLVDPQKIEAIYEVMLKIVKQTNLRDELILKGKEQVKQFSWSKFADSFYDEMMKFKPA